MAGRQHFRPWRLAQLLLRLTLPSGIVRESVMGDLEEEFQRRAARGLPSLARRWHLRQSLALSWRYLGERCRKSPPGTEASRVSPPRSKELFMSWVQELRFTMRALARRPGFSLPALLILSVGIGAGTAIFSVVNGVLLRPLPYPQPDRLLSVHQTNLEWRESPFVQLRSRWDTFPASFPVYQDWLEMNRSFSALGAYGGAAFTLTGGQQPLRLQGGRVTYGVFEALGVKPLLGRAFSPQDDRLGTQNLLLLSHALWQRQFGGDPDVVGDSVRVNDQPFTVIGVMPSGFRFPDSRAQAWRLFGDEDRRKGRSSQFMRVIARLKPGATLGTAQEDMERVTRRIAEANPGEHDKLGFRLVPRLDEVVGGVRPALLMLMGAVGLALLVACANLAGLLLVRFSERRRELAVRAALGAGRGRLLRQMAGESLALALLGGAAGTALAAAGLETLKALLPAGLPRADEITIDWRVLAFSIGISLLTGLLAGLFPALSSSKSAILEALQEAGRGQSAGRGQRRSQAILVVGEVALAFVLLVGAGALIKSFANLISVEKGFSPSNLLVVSLALPTSGYPELQQLRAFHTELRPRLEALPGLRAATAVSNVPFSGGSSSHSIFLEASSELEEINVEESTVWASYFQAMEIPLISGRAFREADREGSPLVAIANRKMADQYWPGRDPIGQRFKLDQEGEAWVTVVGVAGDVRQHGFRIEPRPMLYYHYPQSEEGRFISLVIKAESDPSSLAGLVREAVWQMDPDLPVQGVISMEQLISHSLAAPRFRTLLLGLLAGLAALLAAAGIYGVMAYSVSRRRREIGVRMALGARQRQLLASVLGRGMLVASAGLGLGFVISLFALRILDRFLFGMAPVDPAVMLIAALLSTVSALLASYLPAFRASRVDPVQVLRVD